VDIKKIERMLEEAKKIISA